MENMQSNVGHIYWVVRLTLLFTLLMPLGQQQGNLWQASDVFIIAASAVGAPTWLAPMCAKK